MKFQQSIRKSISVSGIGLHSGKRVSLELRPARANFGIRFVRSDLCESEEIIATVENVQSTTLATTIGHNNAKVSTIEHLMSALWALGVDNCLCVVDGAEVPILDGSALGFANLIRKAGIKRQRAPRRYLRAKKEISLKEGSKWAILKPCDEFSLHYTIDFPHPTIGRQEFRFDSTTNFMEEVAPARTFGFLKDVERMQSMGLALGGSLSNAVVLDDEKTINPEGLRFRDEFVRHKVLDAIGDLSLLGMPLLASIELHRAGHELQTRIIQALQADPTAYEFVSFAKETTSESFENEGLLIAYSPA